MQSKDEIIDWCVIFTVLVQVCTLPLIFMDIGADINTAIYAFNTKAALTIIEQVFNLPLMLMYMGIDINIAMYTHIARYVLSATEGVLLLFQLYFGYLILIRRGSLMVVKLLILLPIHVATIILYIKWGVSFSIPLS